MKILKIIFPIILISFLLFNIFQNWNQVEGYLVNIKYFWLILSGLIALLVYPEAGLIWHLLTKAFSENISFRKNIYIFIISNTSRYIPGTIWQYLGRVELAKRVGQVERKKTLVLILYEVFLLILASITLSLFSFSSRFISSLNLFYWYVFIIFSLIAFHPKILKLNIQLLSFISKKKLNLTNIDLSFKKIMETYLLVLINFFLNGLVILFLYFAFGGDINVKNFAYIISAFAFSWLLGFITPIAPAGFGVVETSLAFFLSSIMPFTLASAIAVSFRFITTLAEFITFLIVLKLKYEKK